MSGGSTSEGMVKALTKSSSLSSDFFRGVNQAPDKHAFPPRRPPKGGAFFNSFKQGDTPFLFIRSINTYPASAVSGTMLRMEEGGWKRPDMRVLCSVEWPSGVDETQITQSAK